jgi:hypothetical protein
MKILIDGNVEISNVLPSILIQLDRYDLGKLVTDGLLVQMKETKFNQSQDTKLYQEIRIKVMK